MVGSWSTSSGSVTFYRNDFSTLGRCTICLCIGVYFCARVCAFTSACACPRGRIFACMCEIAFVGVQVYVYACGWVCGRYKRMDVCMCVCIFCVRMCVHVVSLLLVCLCLHACACVRVFVRVILWLKCVCMCMHELLRLSKCVWMCADVCVHTVQRGQ